MSSFVLYHKKSRPTGRKIGRLLNTTGFGIRPPDYPLDVLVRWGSSRRAPANLVYNNPAAVEAASNKYQALALMRDAGLSTIPFSVDKDYAISMAQKFPIFGRDFKGSGGKDIVIYYPNLSLEQGNIRSASRLLDADHDWYSIYTEAKLEVRVHVVRDRIIRVQGKYRDLPVGESVNRTGGDTIRSVTRMPGEYIRNYANGYRFRTPKKHLRSSRYESAISAVRCLGLDFGAVDMLITRQPMILEVNTAPSCSPLTLSCYCGQLAQIVETDTRGEIKLAPDILYAELSPVYTSKEAQL